MSFKNAAVRRQFSANIPLPPCPWKRLSHRVSNTRVPSSELVDRWFLLWPKLQQKLCFLDFTTHLTGGSCRWQRDGKRAVWANTASPLCLLFPFAHVGRTQIGLLLSILKEPESTKCLHPSIASFRTPRCNVMLVGSSKDGGISATARPTRSWHVVFRGICTTRNAACGAWSCPNSTFQAINKRSALFPASSFFCASLAPTMVFFKCTTRGIWAWKSLDLISLPVLFTTAKSPDRDAWWYTSTSLNSPLHDVDSRTCFSCSNVHLRGLTSTNQRHALEQFHVLPFPAFCLPGLPNYPTFHKQQTFRGDFICDFHISSLASACWLN